MTWETVRFDSLYSVESRNGLTKPSRVRGAGYKMINMGELFSNDRIYDIPMELVPLKDSEKRCSVEPLDLLFARQSLVLEGAGKCSIVMETSPLTVFESHLIRVRLNREIANPLFYYYYFKSSCSPIKTIVSQCAQAGIRGSDLSCLQVISPPLNIQNRIADVLSAYDDLIENNRKQIKLLEEAAQRLYKEWFIDLRFPGCEDTPIHDGIPDGWEKKTVEALCVLSKKTISPDKVFPETPYIGLEHIPRKDFCLSEWGNSSEVSSNKYHFQKYDIIFGQIRPYFHKVGFALVDGVASTDSFVMKPLEKNWGLFLMTVSSEAFVNYSYQTCKEGAKMPRADWNQMKNYTVLVAAENIQSKFESFIREIAGKIRALALHNKYLIEARDRLLPKLMNGEMEV
ncbi:MAG: restriction endonuclease subunit S [Lentisphaeria bacterium]|nr:restriction endonuclease subunit S [Lentisphaeria bacterium]